MKNKSTLIKTVIIVLFSALSFSAAAQTPFSGPSDATTAPPTTATAVAQVLCSGSQILLKGPADATGTIKYQWYKTDNAGVKKLVKEGINKDNAYSETSTGDGYYTYQLVMVNSNNCISDPSDPFNLYVLPALNPVVDGNGSVCEKGQTNSALSITGLDSRFTYTYQWTREGADIATNATSATYTVTEQTAGTYKYAVKVAYTLNTSCTKTAADKPITVIPVPTKPTIQIGN
ncbi:hypothetical protein ABDD95_23205 [Mucilaginibacter sp. PAMB04274]|uniref:hypothetical protein n=1 Tax=Mucilaginibacter sp. PAMB04274 TaxID=3138568 RepID=UPI0031F61F11